MIYNKHDLLLRDDPKVKEIIPEIKNENEYYVYSYIANKKGKKTNIIYDVSPRRILAKITNNCLYVISVNKGFRFSMFSAYGRQLYFADTEEEAIRGYNKLVKKIDKSLSE